MADLVPHAPPMLVVDELVDWEAGRAECRMRLRDDAPFTRDGQVDSVVTLEYMAQAVAACLGHEAFLGGEGVRVGMIVGVRRMELLRPTVDVGAELRVIARRVRGNDTVSRFECGVLEGEETVSTAVMTLFHAEEPPAQA